MLSSISLESLSVSSAGHQCDHQLQVGVIGVPSAWHQRVHQLQVGITGVSSARWASVGSSVPSWFHSRFVSVISVCSSASSGYYWCFHQHGISVFISFKWVSLASRPHGVSVFTASSGFHWRLVSGVSVCSSGSSLYQPAFCQHGISVIISLKLVSLAFRQRGISVCISLVSLAFSQWVSVCSLIGIIGVSSA